MFYNHEIPNLYSPVLVDSAHFIKRSRVDQKQRIFSVDELEKELESSGKPWLPFLQSEQVLAGLYFLKAGANDQQQPHDTDEIYYVLSGSSLFEVGEEKRRIKAGDILFVKAEIKHRFYDIEEDLKLLVFFDQ